MLFLKKKEPNEDHNVKLVAYTIILYVSSIFVPFIVVGSYQSMLYDRSQWFFSTPYTAYITFMAGMLFVSVVLTIYLFARNKWEGIWLKIVLTFLLIGSIPAFLCSLDNYYFVDDEGIHYYALKSFKIKDYNWDNMSKIQIVYRNHAGTTSLYQYIFELKDGSKITIPFEDKMRENRFRVERKIKDASIPVTDNFYDPIVD